MERINVLKFAGFLRKEREGGGEKTSTENSLFIRGGTRRPPIFRPEYVCT